MPRSTLVAASALTFLFLALLLPQNGWRSSGAMPSQQVQQMAATDVGDAFPFGLSDAAPALEVETGYAASIARGDAAVNAKATVTRPDLADVHSTPSSPASHVMDGGAFASAVAGPGSGSTAQAIRSTSAAPISPDPVPSYATRVLAAGAEESDSPGATPAVATRDVVTSDMVSSGVIASDVMTADMTSGVRAPARSARHMVAAEGVGTYIHELLDGRNEFLTRWNTAQQEVIRVWIEPVPQVDGNTSRTSAFELVVRDAFTRWTDAGLPLLVTYVTDAREADVRVRWTDRFNQPINGRTRWSHDSNGWILNGEIVLSLRHPGGRLLDEAALRAITLHEIGHLIGLDHVSDSRSIMAPLVRARDLSDADRATVNRLYRLPAGMLD
jgi:hypothetical protein